MQWSKEYLEAYKEAQFATRKGQECALPPVWTPPSSGFLKLNADVAIPDGADSYRISMVAHNEWNACVWWFGRELVGRPPPSVGEAMAVLHGVKEAMASGWKLVIVETDC